MHSLWVSGLLIRELYCEIIDFMLGIPLEEDDDEKKKRHRNLPNPLNFLFGAISELLGRTSGMCGWLINGRRGKCIPPQLKKNPARDFNCTTCVLKSIQQPQAHHQHHLHHRRMWFFYYFINIVIFIWLDSVTWRRHISAFIIIFYFNAGILFNVKVHSVLDLYSYRLISLIINSKQIFVYIRDSDS